MKKNMSTADRALRTFVAAPAFVAVGILVGPGTMVSWVLYALAVVMLATSSVGSCPLYSLAGLSTRSRRTATTGSAPQA